MRLVILVLLISLFVLSGCSKISEFYGLDLINNPFARDVKAEELTQFLEQDAISERDYVGYEFEAASYLVMPDGSEYVSGNEILVPLGDYVRSGYGCLNFAVDLHNNAEKAGIRCGMVVDRKEWHCLNAFRTTDRGLVYVDASAGSDSLSYYDPNTERHVIPNGKVKVGESKGDTWSEYINESEFLELRW